MHKFFGIVMILTGAILMVHQWGTPEHAMRTAQFLIDLVSAYGADIGGTYKNVYLFLPPIGIFMGIIIIISDNDNIQKMPRR